MHVREATRDDEATIVDELLVPSFEHDEALDPSFNRLDEAAIADVGCGYWLDPDGRTMFVAIENGELIGHVSGNEVAEPPIYERDARVHIDGLYVKEGYRREGVASRLLDRIEQWARNRGCDYLGVAAHARNDDARRFYETEFTLKFHSYRRNIE